MTKPKNSTDLPHRVTEVADPVGDCLQRIAAIEGCDREQAIRVALSQLGGATESPTLRVVLYAASEGMLPPNMVSAARKVLEDLVKEQLAAGELPDYEWDWDGPRLRLAWSFKPSLTHELRGLATRATQVREEIRKFGRWPSQPFPAFARTPEGGENLITDDAMAVAIRVLGLKRLVTRDLPDDYRKRVQTALWNDAGRQSTSDAREGELYLVRMLEAAIGVLVDLGHADGTALEALKSDIDAAKRDIRLRHPAEEI